MVPKRHQSKVIRCQCPDSAEVPWGYRRPVPAGKIRAWGSEAGRATSSRLCISVQQLGSPITAISSSCSASRSVLTRTHHNNKPSEQPAAAKPMRAATCEFSLETTSQWFMPESGYTWGRRRINVHQSASQLCFSWVSVGKSSIIMFMEQNNKRKKQKGLSVKHCMTQFSLLLKCNMYFSASTFIIDQFSAEGTQWWRLTLTEQNILLMEEEERTTPGQQVQEKWW